MPATCTKEEFRDVMIRNYRDKAVGWYDPYSPILDVTNTVRAVRKNIKSAKLTIFGSNLEAIRVQGPYDKMPPARTTEQVVSSWERGEEWERQYCSKNGKYYWVIYPCRLDVEYEEAKECTKEEFRNGMVNWWMKSSRTVGWYDPYSPILDVTDTVKAVRENVKSARLTIFGSNLEAIRVEGPYDEEPPAFSAEQVVANWEKGEEWERQKCPRNGKYYWVIYPCRLDVEYEEVPTAPPEEEKPAPSPFEWLFQLLRMLFPFLPAPQR